jgi:hypothetical protein
MYSFRPSLTMVGARISIGTIPIISTLSISLYRLVHHAFSDLVQLAPQKCSHESL